MLAMMYIFLDKTQRRGLDKVADDFSANAAQTFVADHSAVTIAVAAASTNTGELEASYVIIFIVLIFFI